jgi:hypothetical protein
MRTSDRQRDSIIDTITNWRDQAFHLPSSIVFGNFFQASSFGKLGKKGIEGFSEMSPSRGNTAGTMPSQYHGNSQPSAVV